MKIGMIAILLLGTGLGSARADFLAGSPAGVDPFRFQFDEYGNGIISINGGPLQPLNGSLLADPTQPGKFALTYFLPQLVTTGDARVWDDFPFRTQLGDVLRFTNANGDLNGQVNGDRMLFYSDNLEMEFPPAPADTGFPAMLFPRDNGGVFETLPEGNNSFIFFAESNQYIGISDLPEPASIIMLSIGALCAAGCGWRRRPRSAAA